jgi:primosomal replication protein N
MATAASLKLPSPSGIPIILKDVRRAGRQIVKQRSRKVVVEMTVDEQGAAAMAIRCEAMVQLGEDPDRLIGDRVAQDGGPDNES